MIKQTIIAFLFIITFTFLYPFIITSPVQAIESNCIILNEKQPVNNLPPHCDTGPIGSLTGPCAPAPGAKDLGLTDEAYIKGKKVTVRLCAIQDLPSTSSESVPGNDFYVAGADGKAIVNAGISASVVGLVRAAKAAGVDLRANSSFRTMKHQTSLYNAPHSAPVARPGTSNHQSGSAIDFANAGGFSSGRCTAPGNKIWEWLNANAAKYNLEQLPSECWHWSTSGG